MKITKLSITLEPSMAENSVTRVLTRDENKQWTSSLEGLFPSEIRLINLIQDVISKYNTQAKE